MNLNNKISIIVPVYNGEKFILSALESLKNQTILIDVIIVDDGSKDKTGKLVCEYIQNNGLTNFHYFYKENGGISDARNFGLSKVETEYFGFLDADDSVKNDIYQKMLNQLYLKDADICMCNFDWVYPHKRRLAVDINYENISDIITKMYATLWNKIYRTSWFKSKGLVFPKGLKYEDASVLYRLAPSMDKVCYVNESLVDYNQIEGSITHTFNTNVKDMIEVFKGIKDYYFNHGFNNYIDELEYVTIRFFLGNNFLRACQIKDKKLRKETLKLGYEFLTTNFKEFKKNPYLKNRGFKNLYYRMINKTTYNISAFIFSFLYRFKNRL